MPMRRDGFVIAVTLMVMLLLELLAASMLLIAMHDRAVATARIALAAAAVRAETALARQVGSWEGSDFHDMRVGESRSITDDTTTIRVEKLRGDLFRLTGETPVQPGSEFSGSARASLLLRSFDPQLLMAQLTGALVTAAPTQLIGETIVDAGSPAATCDSSPPAAAVATPFPELVAIAPSVRIAGQPELFRDTMPREPPARTGGLSFAELKTLATRTETSVHVPAPAEVDGRCDEAAPGNWGAPLDPQHPCAEYFPFIVADGDLDLSGGSGQGLLLVTGSLIMRGNASFHGVVIVGGTVLLSGATLTGALYVQSASAASVLLDSTLRYDFCAIERALLSIPSLRRPLFPAGRVWLPAH